MNWQDVAIALVGIACACTGWFARELYQAVSKFKDDLNKLEVKISAEYIRYDRLQDALKPLKDTLDEIKATLQHKADKP